jgi:hypothetical protein
MEVAGMRPWSIAGFGACLLAGCAGMAGTMSTVPRAWRKSNPWGPEAIEARARGELKPLYYTPEMASWAEFARTHLEDGDILFREGTKPRPRDLVLDRILKVASDSPFTHDAIAFHHGEEVWVYDVEPDPEGVRKLPFEFWHLDTVPGTFAVLRVKEPYRHCIPSALAYCEQAWLRRTHFDPSLRLDDERLYCNEMVEKSYRSAGAPPVRSHPHPLPAPLSPLQLPWAAARGGEQLSGR